MAALLSILGQLGIPDPGQNSSQDLQRLLDVFYVLLGVGFLVAIAGHLAGSRTMVIVGVAMIFIGTAVFMVAVGAYG